MSEAEEARRVLANALDLDPQKLTLLELARVLAGRDGQPEREREPRAPGFREAQVVIQEDGRVELHWASDEGHAAYRFQPEQVTDHRDVSTHEAGRRRLARHAGLPEDACWREIAVELDEQLEEAREEATRLSESFEGDLLAANEGLSEAQNRIAVAAGLEWGTPASEIKQTVRDLRDRLNAATKELNEHEFAAMGLDEREPVLSPQWAIYAIALVAFAFGLVGGWLGAVGLS